MEALRNASRVLSAVILTMGLAFAQTIEVPDLITGSKITVGITGGTPNTTVYVEITDDDPIDPETVTVKVRLDSDGNGTAPWTVPNWSEAVFSADGFSNVTRLVN